MFKPIDHSLFTFVEIIFSILFILKSKYIRPSNLTEFETGVYKTVKTQVIICDRIKFILCKLP